MNTPDLGSRLSAIPYYKNQYLSHMNISLYLMVKWLFQIQVVQ